MSKKSLAEYIAADDPLTEDAFLSLLEYREEDALVDFKASFADKEKHWLDLTKDVMAFANGTGGYVCFGVEDQTYSFIGLDEPIIRLLTNTDKVLQKVNRYLDPGVRGLRSKAFAASGRTAAVLFIPSSLPITHVVSKDGKFKFPSGTEKTVLREGTIWVRKSAGNQLVGSRELDGLFTRRLELYKDFILGRIRQVVEAPQDSQVFVVKEAGPDKDAGRRFVISDSPEEEGLRGMSFTVAPQSPEEEVAAWIAMASKPPNPCPPETVVWAWYRGRRDLRISSDMRKELVRFSLQLGLPAFYWIARTEAAQVKDLLRFLAKQPSAQHLEQILGIGATYGSRYYGSLLRDLGKKAARLKPRLRGCQEITA